MTLDIIRVWEDMSTGDIYLLIFCIFIVIAMVWMELMLLVDKADGNKWKR